MAYPTIKLPSLLIYHWLLSITPPLQRASSRSLYVHFFVVAIQPFDVFGNRYVTSWCHFFSFSFLDVLYPQLLIFGRPEAIVLIDFIVGLPRWPTDVNVLDDGPCAS